MFKQIGKNLHKVFLASLVLAQAIAVVSVWAEINSPLPAQFISPTANQQIIIGEEIIIQAEIGDSAYQLSTVHFILTSQVDSSVQVYFQAINNNNIWTADSAWSTANYPAGIYHLTVRASSYNDRGELIYYAQPAGIDINLIAPEEDVPPPQDNDVPVIPLPTVSIIQPVANATISGEQYQAQAQVTNLGDYQLRGVLRRSSGDLSNPRPADDTNGNLHYFNINTTQFSNGAAQLIFFVEANGARQILAEVYVQINNETEEPPTEEPATLNVVEVLSPTANNLTISNDHYPLAIRLNRSLVNGETTGVTLYREQNEARTINLNLYSNNAYRGYLNTLELANGNYQVVFWFNNGQRVVLHNSYYLNINNPVEQEPSEPDEQHISLMEPTGPINTESFILRLRTRFSAENLYWHIIKIDDSAISSSGNMAKIGEGRNWSQSITLPRAVFVNGQYRLTIQVIDNAGAINQAEFTLLLNRNQQNLPADPPAPPADPQSPPNNPEEPNAPVEGDDEAPESPVDEVDFDFPENEQSEIVVQPPVEEWPEDFIDPRCQERNIASQDRCLQWLALYSEDIDPQCLRENIYSSLACEDYLNRVSVDRECQEKNIIDRNACQDYLMEKYAPEVGCRLVDSGSCQQILRNTYLNRLVVRQQRRDKVENVIKPLVGKAINSAELSQQLSQQNLEETLPVKTNEKMKFLLINSQAVTALLGTDRLETVNSAVLAMDNDGDGLPNDLEKYYQTDLNNSDSDGDGYLDGEEVSTNHNPLGEGSLLTARTDFDRVILAGLPLEQPRTVTDKTEAAWQIAEPISQADDSLLLTGQAQPNSWATIYIYSDLPLVMVAKTDASGNWSYAIGDSLADGEHKVYVTVNDDTGKIVKQSEPLSFLIKGAQAVTVDEYFSPSAGVDKVNNFILYYLLGAGFLIIVALGILVYLHRGKESADLNNQIN